MAEGVASASTGAVVADPVYDDPAAEPAPDPVRAPKGWTWNRALRQWIPRTRSRAGQPQAAAAPQPPQPPQQQKLPWLRKPKAAAAAPQQDDEDLGAAADPDPSWMEDDSGSGPVVFWDPKAVGQDVQDDIAGMLALFYSVPADFLITVDPYCFGALNENLGATINATVPIICRSKMAVEFVTGASGLVLWIKLISTLKPFLIAVWQHHVIHSVELEHDEETGQLVAMKQDFSAYTAA